MPGTISTFTARRLSLAAAAALTLVGVSACRGFTIHPVVPGSTGQG